MDKRGPPPIQRLLTCVPISIGDLLFLSRSLWDELLNACTTDEANFVLFLYLANILSKTKFRLEYYLPMLPLFKEYNCCTFVFKNCRQTFCFGNLVVWYLRHNELSLGQRYPKWQSWSEFFSFIKSKKSSHNFTHTRPIRYFSKPIYFFPSLILILKDNIFVSMFIQSF